MFNRGITRLLEALPEFEELDQARVRRLLSNAYADALDLSESATRGEGATEELARVALALESHAILAQSAPAETVRACAFVAAEALSLTDDLRGDRERPQPGPWIDIRRYRRLEAGLLYLIAGYDANAAVSARAVRVRGSFPDDISATARYVSARAEDAVAQIRSVLMMRRGGRLVVRRAPVNAAPAALVRAELWRRLAAAARRHTLWLRFEDPDPDGSAWDDLDAFLQPLLSERAGAYGDIALLARLLAMASDATGERALRTLRDPEGGGDFAAYVEERAAERPLMWPATQRYAEESVRGESRHAAVAVPTGAGKSGVAELAVAHELERGWVLYLAPTNALVAQIRRDLESALAGYPGFIVRGFLGGPEMTGAPEEALPSAFESTVLVMTPEKCTLALRQAPQAFERLALCVVDECHLLGERGTRGVITELVLAHLLTLAPEARVLLLSALVANPEDLAAWLQTVTREQAVAIREPWRPTRTLRTVLGFDRERFTPILEAAEAARASTGKAKQATVAPAALLAGLQGAWQGSDRGDFALVETDISVPVEARAGNNFYYSSNDALSAAAASLAREDHRVLAFIPRNRHWAFSVGAQIDLADLVSDADTEIENQLVLAEHELGVGSKVRELLAQGVAVHTSALLEGERRASELAFVRGVVPLMLATGTMAQGLNLPATAVVIAGTQVGHDPTLTPDERRERAKIQLLNAVGRAGRPQHAARSLAIVVPERPLLFDAVASPDEAISRVPFLRDEDAAATVRSRLGALIDRALRDDVNTAEMTVEELAAFAVLPLDAPDVDAGEVIRRTLGAWARNASNPESAAVIATSLENLGQRFLGERPRWLAEAAYLAGLTVEQMLALHDGFVGLEIDKTEIAEWVDAALQSMSAMPAHALSGIITPDAVRSTRCAAIFDAAASDDAVRDAWQVLREATALWLSGATYDDLAAHAVGPEARGRDERHQRAPRIIRLANDGFGYGLTRAVGGLLALHDVGVTADEDRDRWTLAPVEKLMLDLAPLAVRRGCGDVSSLAWARFAGMPRRLSHLVAGFVPISADASDEEAAALVTSSKDLLIAEAIDEEWEMPTTDAAALRAWKETISD